MILVVALLIGAVGVASLYLYLVPKKTTVYVFKDNYEAGTVVTEDMLTAVQCDSNIVVAGKSSDTSSQFVTGDTVDSVLKTGDSLRMDVSQGMPLTVSLLSVNGGSDVEMSMDPTKIAVSVAIDSISGVTEDLKEGSRVNIYVTTESGTTLQFQNMRIIAVTKSDEGDLSAATIECDKDQSLKLIYASQNGSITFGLVDSSQYEEAEKGLTYEP